MFNALHGCNRPVFVDVIDSVLLLPDISCRNSALTTSAFLRFNEPFICTPMRGFRNLSAASCLCEYTAAVLLVNAGLVVLSQWSTNDALNISSPAFTMERLRISLGRPRGGVTVEAPVWACGLIFNSLVNVSSRKPQAVKHLTCDK